METFIIFIVFIAALFYLGRNTFRAFFAKNNAGCAKGCASCGAVDFEKIEAEISNSKLAEVKFNQKS